MFMASKNFGAMEFAVTRAIRELREDHEFISSFMIAEHISSHPITVQRSLRRLIRAGMVIRGDGSPAQRGFRYDYIGTR